ncbi:MAG: hypothetical protein ACTHN0_00215 [Aquihabitans sp.]
MTDLTATHEPSAADRLELGVEDLHVPEPSADAEGVLLKVGLALPIIGVILIVIAYWNASGSKYVADQVPMLISGGILGIGLAIIGVGLFIRFSLARLLRFWLARMVVAQQTQTDRVVEALGRIEAKLDK